VADDRLESHPLPLLWHAARGIREGKPLAREEPPLSSPLPTQEGTPLAAAGQEQARRSHPLPLADPVEPSAAAFGPHLPSCKPSLI